MTTTVDLLDLVGREGAEDQEGETKGKKKTDRRRQM